MKVTPNRLSTKVAKENAFSAFIIMLNRITCLGEFFKFS